MTGYPSIDKPWMKYYSDAALSAKIPDCTIYEAIKNANQDNLDHVALIHYGKRITYRELFQQIDNVASSLVSMGITKSSIVSICMLNSPETIYLLYALNKIGAVANMVSPISSPEEIVHDICHVHTKHLFTLDIFQEKIAAIINQTELETVVVVPATQSMSKVNQLGAAYLKGLKGKPLPSDVRFVGWHTFCSNASAAIKTTHDPSADAVIVYTGGTTGGSKGVLLTNSSIISTAEQAIISGKRSYAREHTWMQVIPLFVAYGVCCSLQMPLTVGMTLIIRVPTAETISQLCKFKPNHIMYGPAMWEKLADENKDIDLSFLITAVSGGDRLPEAVELKINTYLQKHGSRTDVLNGYGMSEVGAAVAANHWYAHELGSVGIPFTENIISAFDTDSGHELQYNQEGEICVCTPSMMKEYINNPEETANVIRKHDDGKLWVHTGDLGYITENGFVYISGRIKRFITVYDGELYKKVFSLDIEKVLFQHQAIENCAVVAAPAPMGQVPKAFIILNRQYAWSQELEDDIKFFCAEHLNPNAVPVQYIFVDSFPLTNIGKVDYRALERQLI